MGTCLVLSLLLLLASRVRGETTFANDLTIAGSVTTGTLRASLLEVGDQRCQERYIRVGTGGAGATVDLLEVTIPAMTITGSVLVFGSTRTVGSGKTFLATIDFYRNTGTSTPVTTFNSIYNGIGGMVAVLTTSGSGVDNVVTIRVTMGGFDIFSAKMTVVSGYQNGITAV